MLWTKRGGSGVTRHRDQKIRTAASSSGSNPLSTVPDRDIVRMPPEDAAPLLLQLGCQRK